jgi:3-deoxy-D-manno-octulosonic-acid transferase
MWQLVFLLLYNTLTFLITPLVLVLLVCSKRGRSKIWQRLGLWRLPRAEYLWFHGASLGEMSGLIPLLETARKQGTHCRILVTTTSVSAHEKISPYADEVRLLPLDNWIWLRFAFGAANVRALIITETELWPATIFFAQSRGAAVCWVNAFLSDYAWPRYLRSKFFWRPVINCFRLILAVSQKSSERIIALGASQELVKTTGSSKFSLLADTEPRQKIGKLFAHNYPVVILGSLRPGEERFWFPLIKKYSEPARLTFVVAPRHAEKFSFFADKLASYEISFVSWSTVCRQLPQDAPVLLLDSIGQLAQLYGQAQLGFVGGTMEDYGGHNPLEAAQAGVPLCLGPFARNVEPIVDELLRTGAAVLVKDSSEIEGLLENLLQNPQELKDMGSRAFAVAQQAAKAAAHIEVEFEKARIFI